MNIIFEIITNFIIYSFLGWLMESIVRTISERKLINTGFLHGPVCPIYGIGANIMFLFLEGFYDKVVLLFIISTIVLTLWEYIVGVMLEKMFKTKYWDYSNQKFNFQGRVCLVNSICWGVLGVLLIRYIHPFIQQQVLKINVQLLHYIVGIIFLAIIIDMVMSIVKMKNIKSTLERIEKLNKEIKEKINEIRKIRANSENSTTTENIQELVNKLKKKRNRTILHLYRNVYRMKKAFPTINTKEITEILNNKVKIKNISKRIKTAKMKNKKNIKNENKN